MVQAIVIWAVCGASPTGWTAKPPELASTGQVERAEVDRYDLVATYDSPLSGAAALVLERSEDGSRLVVQTTAKRTEILRVAAGKTTRLAGGRGLAGSELTIRRRPGVVTVCTGPETLAEAHADFRTGDCGPAAGAAPPSDLRLQEIGEIVLDDDFFVGAEREGLWDNLLGALRIDVYWDPKQKVDNRPIGACWFANDGPGEHLAATGAAFWDDYSCEVSVRPDADSTVGLAFRVRDAANYAAVTLTADAEGGAARLVEVRDGQAVVLAERPVACRAGQWYRLRAEVVGSETQAWAADEPLTPATLSTAQSGRVGVYATTEGDCRFDDLWVRGLRRVTPLLKSQPTGPWRFATGKWKAQGKSLDCRAASTAVAVASSGEWRDADVRATVRLPAGAEAGLTARWTGTAGYAFLARRESDGLRCRLAHVSAAGDPETLAEALSPLPTDGELRLVAAGAALRGYLGDTCVVRAWDGRLTAGEIGVVACDGQAGFAEFAAGEPALEDEVSELLADGTDQSRPGAEHGAFEPFIGQLWRPLAGRAALADLDGEPAIALNGAALRYYCPRPGDVCVSADLLRTDGQAVSLTICADGGQEAGYSLALTGEQLQLTRNGQAVGEVAGVGAPPLGLSLRRDGPFVVGQAGAAVVSYRDPEPLPVGYARLRAEGRAVLDNLNLGASHALAYRFDRVEPDWVEAGGEWLFHSGMACIPWAYWLSGDGREAPAVIWNRRQAPADLSVRFDVSEYTVGYESGEHVHYPYHDISLALAGDGQSLDSGYRFVIGAEGGRKTRLLRQGQVVAETTDPRFTVTMGSHCNSPRAVEVVAEKRGATLSLTVNSVLALTYEDAEPLGRGQVALAVDRCRANFRDLFVYREDTWRSPLGVDRFGR